MSRGGYVSFDSPELSFLMGNWKHLLYFRVTVVVVALIAFFAFVLPQWPKVARIGAGWWQNRGGFSLVAAATMTGVMVYNLLGIVAITQNISQLWVDSEYHSGRPELVRDAGVEPGDTVMEASSVSWQTSLKDQHEVYWRTLQTFDPSKGPPPGNPEWVIASTGTGKPTDWYGWDYGYQEVLRYRDVASGTYVVWKLKSP